MIPISETLVLSRNSARSSSPTPKTGQERSATFTSNSLFKSSDLAPSRSLTSSSTSRPKTSSPSLFSDHPPSGEDRANCQGVVKAQDHSNLLTLINQGQIRIKSLFVVQLQSSSKARETHSR